MKKREEFSPAAKLAMLMELTQQQEKHICELLGTKKENNE